ncbi:MAG: ABC transporter substrate-binding protein [Acidimicrobiia bacterium]
MFVEKLGGRRWIGLRALVAAALLIAPACGGGGDGGGGDDNGASADTSSAGTAGEPIHLTIGYQPYYTQAWSGVAMRGKEFWKKHLPQGSTVTFQVGLQGAVIVNQLVAGKQQIGYMGDMPSLVATSKRDTRDLRIIATLGMAQDQCNIFLASKDAPDFKSPTEAVEWMGGKTVATPTGSCTDRFTQAVFQDLGVEPSAYLNQSIEVISSNFQNDRIDGATVWEPVAARLVNQGLAKRVASGASFDQNDAGFLVASQQLLDTRPDAVEGYLAAELEAQQWVADPANAMELAQLAVNQTEGYTLEDMWDAMFETLPADEGGPPDSLSNRMPFIVDDKAQEHINKSWAFLNGIKVIPVAEPLEGIVADELARKVLTASGATFPVLVKTLPKSDFKG